MFELLQQSYKLLLSRKIYECAKSYDIGEKLIQNKKNNINKKITSPVSSNVKAKSGLNVQKYENDDRKISHGQYNISLSVPIFFFVILSQIFISLYRHSWKAWGHDKKFCPFCPDWSLGKEWNREGRDQLFNKLEWIRISVGQVKISTKTKGISLENGPQYFLTFFKTLCQSI